MPDSAAEAGAVDLVLPLPEIGAVLVDVVSGAPLPVAAEDRTSAEALFGADDEVSALYRSLDWRNTELGPVSQWPEELRTLVSAALETPIGVCILWGPDLLQLYNRPYRLVMGDKHPDGLGQANRECWPEVWHLNEPIYADVLAGRSHRYEDALFPLARHGPVKDAWFDLSYSPLRTADGQVAGVLVTVVEKTAQVLARRRLATLNRLAAATSDAENRRSAFRGALRAIVEDASDVPYAIGWTLDHAGGRAHLVEAIGTREGGPMAPNVVSLTGPETSWPLGQVLQEGQPRLVEQLSRRFRGQSVGEPPTEPDTAYVVSLPDGGGAQPFGVMVLGLSRQLALDEEYRRFLDLLGRETDGAITKAGIREHDRERMERMAELDRAKTEFFSNVSHEFRTPLTLMLGPLEETLHRAEELPADLRADLDLVHRNTLRLLRLVGTLLDFSQAEAGRLKARMVPTDLARLTGEIAAMFRSAAEASGLKLDIRLVDLNQPVWVDPEMWEKVVSNLISNALKFTWQGRVSVSLRALPQHAELVVADTGVGIPEAEQTSVFKRFHQVEGARGRTHEGAGIGLALVWELVRLHHGRIRVVSEEGHGSVFTVWVPFGARPAGPWLPTETPPATQIAAGMAEEAARWATADPADQRRHDLDSITEDMRDQLRADTGGPRILVVDDNTDMREYLTRLLGRYAHVQEARDGAEALAVLEHGEPPDLVLSDVMMPNLDGFQLVRRIRSDPALAQVPVILVTARAAEQNAIDGLRAGADDYVVKPFSPRELVARIAGQLELASLRRQNEQRFRALVDASFDVVYRMSPDWTRMDYLAGRGFIADTTDPSHTWLEAYIDEADRDEVLTAIHRAIATKSVFELEHRVRRADGTLGRTLSRAVPLLDDDGRIVEWVGTAIDITR
jgi:signal transduction histidine kinase/FixJ family two-component response regulator